MSNNPAACFSNTQAVWAWSSQQLGGDISGKGRSFTTISGITAGTLDQIPAGIFTASSRAQLINPAFLALNNLSLEFLIQPAAMTTTGFVIRAGDVVTTNELGFGLRLLNGNTWSALKRGNFAGQANGRVLQVSNASVTVTPGQLNHVVAVFTNGAFTRIYINGIELLLTHTNFVIGQTAPIADGPLTGPIPILPAYELAIGDQSTNAPGFIGTLGRVVAYAGTILQPQPAASYRLQRDQLLAVNMGPPAAAGAANHGPVAVPHTAGPVAAGSPLLIPVATRGFDADSNMLTALLPADIPGIPNQGTRAIVDNQLQYTPNVGTGGVGITHTVPQRVRDPSNAESSGIVRVQVTGGVTPPPPPPPGWPYPQSQLYEQLSFNGNLYRYAQDSDQLAVSEDGSNGLLFAAADGTGWTENSVVKTEWRVLRATGTPPSSLSGTSLAMSMADGTSTKPRGILSFGAGTTTTTRIAVWYVFQVGTSKEGRTHVARSDNGGSTFALNDATDSYIFRANFGDTTGTEGLVVWGALQLGANYAAAGGVDNDYIYCYLANPSVFRVDEYADGLGPKNIWLARVKWKGTDGAVANITDRSKYQLLTGYNATTDATTWGTLGNFSTKIAVFTDANGMALYFNVFWHASINKFVATYIHAGIGTAPQGIAVAISDSPFNPNGWEMIGYVRDLDKAASDETDWYLSVSAPARWNNGTTMHFGVSTYNETTNGGSGDNLIVTPVTLTPKAGAGAPVNQTPPSISGTTLQIPSTLTSTQGQWTGTPLISYSYQWKRDGAAIPNQTGTSYVTVTADADRAITCEITARNTASPGGVAKPSSNALAPFRPIKTGWPYPESGLYSQLNFNGDLDRYAQGSDQFPVTEESGGGLLFAGNDGNGWNNNQATKTGWRVSRVTGTPPNGLSGSDTAMFVVDPDAKSMGILAFNTNDIAHWYTWKSNQADKVGNTHVALSTDGGSTVAENDNVGQEIFRWRQDEDFVACGTLQLGANYAAAGGVDNDYIYVYTGIQRQQSVEGYADSTGNKDVWLTRVKWKGTNGSVANIADRSKYAILTGYDAATDTTTWGSVGNLNATKYIVYRDLNGISVHFSVYWHSAISKFVATYAHAGIGSANQGIAVAISDSPWDRNGWRMIGYVRDLENSEDDENNWYLSVVAPSRWNNGSTMHFGVNTYVELTPGGDNAFGGSGDNLIVTPVTLTSTSSGAPQNQTEPVISSNGLEPATLTSTQGQWTGTAPISYAYQWKRDGSNITGQTAATYLTTAADIGHSLTCQVTATNTASPGGVAEISNAIIPGASPFAVVYPSPFTDTTGKTVKVPGVGGVPSFQVNTGNNFAIGNNEIWDLRGLTATVHENANSASSFNAISAPASSVICGGRSTSSNSKYFGDTAALPWGKCRQNPNTDPKGSCPIGWTKDGVHGNTDTGGGASGNYASLYFKGPCDPGFRAHGFYIKRTMDAVVPGDDTQGAIVENSCFVEIRDDVIQDDSQNEFTFRGCYLQGHGIFSWKPGNQSPDQAKSGKIMTVENCVIHLDRMHYMGEDTPGDSGSKRADKYFSPQNRNNTIIHPFQNPINTFAGMGAKWLHKTDQSPPTTRPGSLKIRYKMKNVLVRFDTPSVDGINEGEAFPYTSPIDGGESTYENVHVVWLGPNYGTSAGPVAWDTVMSAKTGQTKAELLAMGITIHDGGAGGTSEQDAFDYWQYHRDAWFAAHGYNSTSDTFVWNRPGEAY